MVASLNTIAPYTFGGDGIINISSIHSILRLFNNAVEMGRMPDYDIRPKPKVWAGSPNECRTFGRMLCARMKQRLLLVSALSG